MNTDVSSILTERKDQQLFALSFSLSITYLFVFLALIVIAFNSIGQKGYDGEMCLGILVSALSGLFSASILLVLIERTAYKLSAYYYFAGLAYTMTAIVMGMLLFSNIAPTNHSWMKAVFVLSLIFAIFLIFWERLKFMHD